MFAGVVNISNHTDIQAAAGDEVVLQWNKNFGGSDQDRFSSVVATPDGGCVVAGDTVSVDGDLTGMDKGGDDAIIVKYSSDGTVVWKNTFGGSDDDLFRSVTMASDGGFVAVGYSWSNDGDLLGLNKGDSDAIIAKYSSNGVLEWSKNFGGNRDDYFESVIPDSDGGVIVAGYSNSTDGDLVGLNKGSSDAIIVKYSANGTLEWNKNFGGSEGEIFFSATSVLDGGYVAVGYSISNDGDLAGQNKHWEDAIIAKFSSDGTLEWGRDFGGYGFDLFWSVASTPDGGCIAVGISAGSTDGDLTGIDKGGDDAIIVKYSSDGTVVWKKTFGGSDFDSFGLIISAPDGGYVVLGGSGSTDGDLTGTDISDGWRIIVKYNSNDDIEWIKRFDFDGGSVASIAMTSDGGYIIAGYVYSAYGYMDAVIAKYLDMSEPILVIPPLLEPDTPNGSANSDGCNPVKVTLKTNVPIVVPNGWTKVDDLTYTKVYTRNATESVPMVGLNGVTGENIEIVIDSITCRPTNPILPPNTGLKK